MADETLTTESVNVVMGPRGVQIDKNGRIQFSDPEVLQAIITGRIPGRPELAAEGNTIQCVCNNYQCGKAVAKPTDIAARG